MVKLTELIAGIRQAVDTASEIVVQKNIDNFLNYFKEVSDEEKKNIAKKSLSPSSNEKGSVVDKIFNPKMVALQFQKDTSIGPVDHYALVPLISIAPMSYLQPSEITFEMDLEFLEQNNEIVVGFPPTRGNNADNDKIEGAKRNAKLTLKIDTTNKPASLSAIIEGYDKNLRAQIPC